jgi:Protein of unknown function (DUF4230)
MRAARGSRLPGVLVLAAVAVAGAIAIPALLGFLPNLNPFATKTKDRSQPVVLRSLQRMSEYRAATANLQVIVDIEEDANLLPSFIKGERTLFVAAGTVDGTVDFSKLDRRAVTVSDDRRGVRIVLPAAQLSDPRLDLQRSKVFDRDRGLLDRVAGAVSEDEDRDRELFALAERKLAEGARADGGLVDAAQDNTRAMLTGLLRGLGFRRIDVQFAPAGT